MIERGFFVVLGIKPFVHGCRVRQSTRTIGRDDHPAPILKIAANFCDGHLNQFAA
jgi:hypothetical protein